MIDLNWRYAQVISRAPIGDTLIHTCFSWVPADRDRTVERFQPFSRCGNRWSDWWQITMPSGTQLKQVW